MNTAGSSEQDMFEILADSQVGFDFDQGVGTISLGALVGFFTVLGIAARNGIMMVTHFQHLERYEGAPFGYALVMRGASERLSPILMTALATALALAPLVVFGDRPGQEIENPMAIVILGGLATSTLLNLFVLPAMYLRFGTRGRRGKDPDDAAAIAAALPEEITTDGHGPEPTRVPAPG